MIQPVLIVGLALAATSLSAYFCYVSHETAQNIDQENATKWLAISVGAATVGSFIGSGFVAYVIRTREKET